MYSQTSIRGTIQELDVWEHGGQVIKDILNQHALCCAKLIALADMKG